MKNKSTLKRKTHWNKKSKKSALEKKKEARAKKLKKEREMWEEFGLKKPSYVRYVGLQGVAWFVTSKAVRMQEFVEYDGYCVDGCGGKVQNWYEADCGHFQGAGKAKTRFRRENLGLQLKGCNKLQQEGDASRTMGFAKTIDNRYGKGTADHIIEESLPTYKRPEKELREIIHYYLKIISQLEEIMVE